MSTSRQRIKILFLIDALLPGGTEKQLILLADALPRDRFEPVIGVLRGDYRKHTLDVRTPIVKFDCSGPCFLKDVSVVWRLNRYLGNEKFNILQTQHVESEVLGTLAAMLCRRRPVLISTRRNLYHWIQEQPLSFHIVRRTVRWANRVLVNSHVVAQECQNRERISPEKIAFIPNAVDVDRFNSMSAGEARRIMGLEPEGHVIGVVGNWRPVKGLASFLNAAARVSRQIDNARFVLVGFGPQENELRSLSRKLGIQHRTTFLRSPTDIPIVIAAFDVAVQPSLSESFSNALLEYMAAAKPIVATTVGDAARVIQDHETGLLVHPDSPDQLAASILYLCRNQEKAAEMGRRAREKAVVSWSLPRILTKYEGFYEQLVYGRA